MKPPYIEEDIPILKDDSIPVSEKIDYLESWKLKAESDKIALEKQHDNIEFYGPHTPTKSDLAIYGTEGPLDAKEYKKRQWESKLRRLKKEIKDKENSINSLNNKLKKYQKLQRNQQIQVKSSNTEIKPVDKREWIEAKREELKDQFNTDDDWAKHVLKLFRKEFDTTKGSITSMKSYGIYKR